MSTLQLFFDLIALLCTSVGAAMLSFGLDWKPEWLARGLGALYAFVALCAIVQLVALAISWL